MCSLRMSIAPSGPPGPTSSSTWSPTCRIGSIQTGRPRGPLAKPRYGPKGRGAPAPRLEPHGKDDPLDPGAEGSRRVTVTGVTELERLVTSVPGLDGVVLGLGHPHGPGNLSPPPARTLP